MKTELLEKTGKSVFDVEVKENTIRIKNCNMAKKLFGRCFTSKTKTASLLSIQSELELKDGMNEISKEMLISFINSQRNPQE